MDNCVQLLMELSKESRNVWPEEKFTGRISPVPDYSRPVLKTGKHLIGRGIAFPFRINSITKKRSTSSDGKTKGLAQGYQRYIERKSEVEKVTPNLFELISAVPSSETDMDLFADGYLYPRRVIDKESASFGTLGRDKHERAAFWRDIEKNETGSRRIQYRLSTVFPSELTLRERCLAAIEFCSHFEKRALPYWAACHKPGPRSEAGLCHMHIVLYDRPTGRDVQGMWAHVASHTHADKNYGFRKRYPHRSNKDRWVLASDNLVRFKEAFENACNRQLELGNHKERFDSHKTGDMEFIKKTPKFMPDKFAAFEYMGLNTNHGYRKTGGELRQRLSGIEKPWKNQIKNLISLNAPVDKDFSERQIELVKLARKGLAHARMGAISGIISGAAVTRMNRRERFLYREIGRFKNGKNQSESRKSTNDIYIAELAVIQKHAPALRKIAKDHEERESFQNSLNAKSMKMFDNALAEFKARVLHAAGSSKNASAVEETSPGEKFDWDDFLRLDFLADEMSRVNKLFSADHYAEGVSLAGKAEGNSAIGQSKNLTPEGKPNVGIWYIDENPPLDCHGRALDNKRRDCTEAAESNLGNVECNDGHQCFEANETGGSQLAPVAAGESATKETIYADRENREDEIETTSETGIKDVEFHNLIKAEGVKPQDIPDDSIRGLRVSESASGGKSSRDLPFESSNAAQYADETSQDETNPNFTEKSNRDANGFIDIDLEGFATAAKVTLDDVAGVFGNERESVEKKVPGSTAQVKIAHTVEKKRLMRSRVDDLER